MTATEQIGVFGASLLAIRLGLAAMPEGGSGFTIERRKPATPGIRFEARKAAAACIRPEQMI